MAQSALIIPLADPAATAALGAALAAAVRAARPAGLLVFLDGELGAGKTALVRALLGHLGHAGRVPSPTYTLVEPYRVPGYAVLHADLYRLRSPDELDDLALLEELGPGTLALVEWPERAAGRLPPADLTVTLRPEGDGRTASLTAGSPAGRALLAALPPVLPAGPAGQ